MYSQIYVILKPCQKFSRDVMVTFYNNKPMICCFTLFTSFWILYIPACNNPCGEVWESHLRIHPTEPLTLNPISIIQRWSFSILLLSISVEYISWLVLYLYCSVLHRGVCSDLFCTGVFHVTEPQYAIISTRIIPTQLTHQLHLILQLPGRTLF